MNTQTDWAKLSDEYAAHTPETIGETIHPNRPISMADIDDIFAGRPLAEKPRAKADVLCKTYLTAELDEQVKAQAAREGIGKSALIRKALVAYLASKRERPSGD